MELRDTSKCHHQMFSAQGQLGPRLAGGTNSLSRRLHSMEQTTRRNSSMILATWVPASDKDFAAVSSTLLYKQVMLLSMHHPHFRFLAELFKKRDPLHHNKPRTLAHHRHCRNCADDWDRPLVRLAETLAECKDVVAECSATSMHAPTTVPALSHRDMLRPFELALSMSQETAPERYDESGPQVCVHTLPKLL